MDCCILTVIKNEHDYLDEWIGYHLEIGIAHIFIFEDMDSDSHKEITDKYGNKVSLGNISDVMDDDSKNDALELKLTKRRNAQDIYFKKALAYLQQTYADQYKWCFVIDNDEFIALDDGTRDINDVMEQFNGYDAVVMQWKCYGANGHISKPDYKDNGVVNTYTKPSSYIGHYILEFTTKTCYNLQTFKETFLHGCHQPTDECKWCRSDFSHDRKRITYKNIYIKHYITKSWEEFIEKRKRGYFMGFARTTDMFFMHNPDMVPKRKELIGQLNEEKLIVLPYKQCGAQGNEIQLALTGWKIFCAFKYHFIVIGEFNKELETKFPWVQFINCPSIEGKKGQYKPHLDMQNKFSIISKLYSQAYDGFIFTTDDEYPIKPFDIEDVTGIFYHASSFTGCEKCPTYFWKYDKWKTRQLLDREGLPHVNYTTHHPYFMEFRKLTEIRKKFRLLDESYVFDDIYFNYFKHEEPILDSKIRLGIWSRNIFEHDFDNAVNDPNIKFVCNSVEGWCKGLEEKLWAIYSKEDNNVKKDI